VILTKKYEIVKEVSKKGITFLITSVETGAEHQYKVGKLHFISHSADLSLGEV
jgi:hypothetical protein